MLGRYVRPFGARNVLPTVVSAIATRGRSGTSCRRLVERTRRPDSSASVSASAARSSAAASGSSSSWSDSSGSSVGRSSSRCQPSRHCCMRSRRLRSAQGGHLRAWVEPHGIGTTLVSPVVVSVSRDSSGRTQTPLRIARSCSTSGAMSANRSGPVRPVRSGLAGVVVMPCASTVRQGEWSPNRASRPPAPRRPGRGEGRRVGSRWCRPRCRSPRPRTTRRRGRSGAPGRIRTG